MADPKVLLFTNQFPFGSSEQFLEAEIFELAKYSNDITVLPGKATSGKRSLPSNVQLDLSYANFIGEGSLRRMIWLIRHLVSVIRGLIYHKSFILKGDAFKRIVKFVYISSRTEDWMKATHQQRKTPAVLYTYWFEAASFGLAKFSHRHSGYKTKTRVHRQDLYEETHYPSFSPCRKESIRLMDEIFSVSQNGMEYLKAKYSSGRQKYRLARLGVKDPGFIAVPSDDGVLRVVSCSFVVEVKRLDLLYQSLVLLANGHPDKSIIWHHIGKGPLSGHLQTTISTQCPSNLSCQLLGTFSNQEVIDFYRTNPVDAFVNVSSSEGIPVSIMEAQSCGIPVIATAVGGTSEIVNAENGMLLSPQPNPTDVAEALTHCFSETFKKKKMLSRLSWKENYQAVKNYQSFYQKLVT